MYDPEFDGDLPKKDLTTTFEPMAKPRSRAPGLVEWLRGWPIPRFAQAVFAESFGQAIVEGLAVDQAIWLAAEVNPSRRFRPALRKTAKNVRSGYEIEAALEKTRARVLPGLKAALRVGGEHGSLAEELASFAKRTGGFTKSRYFRAIGRSTEAIDFADALARLLRDQRLTVRAVRAAGEVASADHPRFSKAVQDVANEMENGRSLVESLSRHTAFFDKLYCGLLEAARSREEMRACLGRLGLRP